MEVGAMRCGEPRALQDSRAEDPKRNVYRGRQTISLNRENRNYER